MKRRVLVIEDNEQNLYLMEFLLTRHNFEVALARDGREGIAKAKTVNADLILLDIQLPEMSGHDVARAIRKDPRLAAVPIVAVTSYAMPGDREQALAAGCTGYIEKPINPDTFVTQLEAYLVSGTEEAPSP
ncbi:MAG: response regulator [Deltaproteobacteria bacterium]|nr:response regulator [Deltaproteobacteria bacterium]